MSSIFSRSSCLPRGTMGPVHFLFVAEERDSSRVGGRRPRTLSSQAGWSPVFLSVLLPVHPGRLQSLDFLAPLPFLIKCRIGSSTSIKRLARILMELHELCGSKFLCKISVAVFRINPDPSS